MVHVVLNLNTEEDSDNLGKKGGGKRGLEEVLWSYPI